MAFTTAIPLVTLVADNLVRISNSLDERETAFGLVDGASGTISLAQGTGADITLPPAFKPQKFVDGIGAAVSLQASIQVYITKTDYSGVVEIPVKVVKTGTTPADFLITLTDDANTEGESCAFELYIRFH